MPAKRDIMWRIAMIYFGVFVVALVILGKIVFLQVIEKEKWTQKMSGISQNDIVIPANRGNIYADDGRLLATSVPEYEIFMDLNESVVKNELFNNKIDSLAICLSGLFGNRSWDNYKKQLVSARSRGERYYPIKRKVTYAQLQKLKKFPIFRQGQYKGGLIVKTKTRRKNPFQYLALRTLGYTTESGSGNVVGIEGAFDTDLTGKSGLRLERRLAGGMWVPVNNEKQIAPVDGLDVITTLNINIQDVAESALMKQLKLQNANHGCVVLMEVKTGHIKAITNLKLDEEDHKYYETYNYAIGESTEPGSTFKLPVLMAAFEDGFVDLDDSVDTKNGIKQYYDRTMRDHHEGGFGKISVQEVFEKSSNIGISTIINDHYKKMPKKFIDRLNKMNINEKLGLKINGEGVPHISDPKDKKLWSGVSLPWISHGYEVQMTPLHILTFYNAVANDGRMVKPLFVKYLKNNSIVEKEFKTEIINSSICSKETIRKAKIMLEGVVERGTGKTLWNSNYKIAGKTGTAQVAQNSAGYRINGRVEYRASFVGYFPADKPKYSCIVVISNPTRGSYFGVKVAGTVFREISDKIYSLDPEMQKTITASPDINNNNNIPPSFYGKKKNLTYVLEELNIPFSQKDVKSEWIVTFREDGNIRLNNRVIRDNQVPSVKGMGARDAVFLLENAGLTVKLRGRGIVKSQSIPQGTAVRPGNTIIIELGQ